jgi:hypothetical protein
MDALRILKESIDRKDFHDLGKRLDEAELIVRHDISVPGYPG